MVFFIKYITEFLNYVYPTEVFKTKYYWQFLLNKSDITEKCFLETLYIHIIFGVV